MRKQQYYGLGGSEKRESEENELGEVAWLPGLLVNDKRMGYWRERGRPNTMQ